MEQLDKPQPVKVKKFVADFIAEQKKLGHTLSYSIDASMSDIVAEWYWDNSELFALAWIFGKVVEKGRHGKLYTLTIRDYGVFVVTKDVYEKVKVGDEVML
ncbi:DUF1372 family protein [Streptococcus pseudopneumoniae]|nr:DUF1372 family protein [Streptococcus pseudopneumoniae]